MRDFNFPGRSQALATGGMAATSMPAATLAALDMLRAGGNALDAAVAAVAVLCVIEPASTGIGGDCFCLYAPAGRDGVIALNGSGRAPAAASVAALRERGVTALENTSAHAVTVPGAISAWETLLAAHGTKGLDEVLRPAIGIAEHGHPVHARVAQDWATGVEKLNKGGARSFLPGGRAPVEGDIFRQPALAATLRAVARDGARAFYEGPIAADMVATLRARGGLHTEADFAAGRSAAEFVTPIPRRWRGLDIWQCPPNGQGFVTLMMLGMLERLGRAPDGPLGVIRLHRHIEAARLAYRDRDAFLADPAQAPMPLDHLLSDAYLADLAAMIADDHALAELPAPGRAKLPEHADTVYLSVVDRDGNACSFINSLFQGFGSGILAQQSGVMLHNRGFGFRLDAGHPNAIAPGKRPMHTIIPGMATENGKPLMAFGVMGGHYQPVGQSWLLANHFEYGLDLQESIDLPRLFPSQGKVEVERGIPAEAAAALARRGHSVVEAARPHGGGQAIRIDHARGVLIGASDPRKDGLAMGYDR